MALKLSECVACNKQVTHFDSNSFLPQKNCQQMAKSMCLLMNMKYIYLNLDSKEVQ